ncbi:MAG: PAS domain S-box protein [Candidatus Nanopelagicales bacterium]
MQPTADAHGDRDARDALTASERHYRMLAEHASDLVAFADNSGVLQWFSESIRTYGWEPHEVVGHSAAEFLHPDDLPLLREVGRVTGEGGVAQVEWRIAEKDHPDAWHWFRVHLQPVTDDDGVVIGRVSGWQNIDAEKLAAEQASVIAARSSAALASMIDPHVLFEAVRDADGRVIDLIYVEANDAALRVLPMPAEQLLGNSLMGLFGGTTSTRVISWCRQALGTGRPVSLDDEVLFSEIRGSERRFDIRVVSAGVHDLVSFTWRDVTDRFLAAQTLAASEERFHMMFAEHDAVMLLINPRDGTIVDANASACAFYGYDHEALCRLKIDDINTLPHEEVRRLRLTAMEHRWTAAVFPHRLSDGTIRQVEVHTSPIHDGEELLFSVIHDVTAAQESRSALAASEERFRTAMESASIGMCLVTPEGALLRVNPALCEFLGRSAEDLGRRTWQELTHPDDLAKDLALLAEVLAGRRDTYRLAKRYLRPDGAAVWGDLSVGSIRDENGEVQILISQIADITEQRRARQALAESEEHYRLLAHQVSDVVVRGDTQGVMQWVSPSITPATGWSPDDLIGHPFLELVHPDDRTEAQQGQKEVATDQSASMQIRLRLRGGSYRWFDIRVDPLHDDRGAITGRVGRWRDVSDEVATRNELAASERRYHTLIDRMADVTVATDDDGRITFVSAPVIDLLGWTPEELVGRYVPELVHPDDLKATVTWMQRLVGEGTGRLRGRLLRRDGTYQWVESTGQVQFGSDGRPISRIGVWRDASEAVARESAAAEESASLQRLAGTDTLTGLSNRRELQTQLAALLARRRTGQRTAVLFCDVDNLKQINDTEGHASGDLVLTAVARRLRRVVRTDDVCARIGGDEFVVVLNGVHSSEQATQIAEKIRVAVSTPIATAGGAPVEPTLSIGVAVAAPGEDPDRVLERADSAMYDAKRGGRDRVSTAP